MTIWHEEQLLIDGKLVAAEGGATYENISPSTEEVLGVAADASVADADRAAFTRLMREMELVRRRSGAVGWALYEDPAEPELMLEVFMVDSWAEHLRQHERGTRTDAVLRDRIRALHRGAAPPAVTHLLAVD